MMSGLCAEHRALSRPIEEKERVLTSAGPTWKAPTVMEVLRMLPFLRHTRRRIIQVRKSTDMCTADTQV